jgi:hypothetical protein
MITIEDFAIATGYTPQDDDLERCNCEQAGMPGHMMCGWNEEANLPVFVAGYRGAKMWPSQNATS